MEQNNIVAQEEEEGEEEGISRKARRRAVKILVYDTFSTEPVRFLSNQRRWDNTNDLNNCMKEEILFMDI